MVKVRVGSWEMYYAYESAHKNRSTRMCVFSPRTFLITVVAMQLLFSLALCDMCVLFFVVFFLLGSTCCMISSSLSHRCTFIISCFPIISKSFNLFLISHVLSFLFSILSSISKFLQSFFLFIQRSLSLFLHLGLPLFNSLLCSFKIWVVHRTQ